MASEDRIYKTLHKARKSGDNIKVKPIEALTAAALLKTCHSTTAFRIESEYSENALFDSYELKQTSDRHPAKKKSLSCNSQNLHLLESGSFLSISEYYIVCMVLFKL